MFKKIRRLISFASAALGVIAVADQMCRPEDERTWEGVLLGVVPYDFRPPTIGRIKQRLWNPDDPRLFTPHVFGVGWTVNFYRLVQIVSGPAKRDGDG